MRMLHTMLRVGDLDRSLRFYTDVLGMRLLRRNDYPDGKFTLAFVGYGEESQTAVLELTHNWGVDKYELGNAYGHVAIAVDDAYKACEDVKKRGGKVTREAGPMKHGAPADGGAGSAREARGSDPAAGCNAPEITAGFPRASTVASPKNGAPAPRSGATVIAFVEDPDGYKIELIERK